MCDEEARDLQMIRNAYSILRRHQSVRSQSTTQSVLWNDWSSQEPIDPSSNEKKDQGQASMTVYEYSKKMITQR